jgi:hypothetical protein
LKIKAGDNHVEFLNIKAGDTWNNC